MGRLQIDSTFYVTGKIGYNIFQMDEEIPEYISLKGGLFYGIGGGAVFNDIMQLEVLYSTHNGGWIDDEEGYLEYDISWKYSKLGISIGYKF